MAPFGYDGGEADHWYAWDIDACWILYPARSRAAALAEAADLIGEKTDTSALGRDEPPFRRQE